MAAATTPLVPPPAQLFVAFARNLRDFGFPVVTQQTVTFLKAISLLGPRSMRDVYWAARATLGPTADRLGEFDALFRAAFEGEGLLPTVESACDTDGAVHESSDGALEPLSAESVNQSGAAATALEALSAKRFTPVPPHERLNAMRRSLADVAPKRRGFRRVRHRRGDKLDLRHSLAAIARRDAEALAPAWTRRVEKERRVLLLIDISGSMKAHTDDYLRFAHALTQALTNVETFAFGTRLTRLTKSLRHKQGERALAELAPAVADWAGGTRIGESLARFLAIPRFSKASRGALVAVLSDGLERGDPELMVRSVRRLAALAWRFAWLTPLAADPQFKPETAALQAILPLIDHLGDASGIGPLCDFMEGISEQCARVSPTPFPLPARGRGALTLPPCGGGQGGGKGDGHDGIN